MIFKMQINIQWYTFSSETFLKDFFNRQEMNSSAFDITIHSVAKTICRGIGKCTVNGMYDGLTIIIALKMCQTSRDANLQFPSLQALTD